MIAAEERIVEGDVLEIRVAGKSDGRNTLTVDTTGIFRFPFVENPVNVACKTPAQIEEELTQAYTEYLIDPRVTVVIREQPSRFVVVKGAVKQSWRFDLRRPATVGELIALAGGPTEFFSGKITVTRQAGWTCEGDQVHRTLAESMTLTMSETGSVIIPADREALPGMQIELEAKPLVFVVGNVARPRILVLEPNLTITRAIAMSGGILPDTVSDKIRILRACPGTAQRLKIPINLTAIGKGKAVDLVLEDNDVIVVPSRHDRHGDSFHSIVPAPPPVTVIE